MNRPNNGRVRARNTLPRPRSDLSKYITLSLFSICITINSFCILPNSIPLLHRLFLNMSFPSTLILVEQLTRRLIHGVEETRHLHTYYQNKILVFLKDIFQFSPINLFVFSLSIFHFVQFLSTTANTDGLFCSISRLSMFAFLEYLLKLILNINSAPLDDSLWLENSHGLDYGSGIAHSFYHGYLKLVIPKTGDGEKHLQELMQDYESKHDVVFDCYKLIILIPKSLYCPVSLKNNNSIEESVSLEEKLKTVAGVQKRSYKNSVYKILDGSKRHYVVAEYATPLKTFRDVVNSNGVHSKYYKKHKNEIVLQFYRTLKTILQEQEETRDFCELIFFDDMDENNEFKDVGQVILKRLKKLRAY